MAEIFPVNPIIEAIRADKRSQRAIAAAAGIAESTLSGYLAGAHGLSGTHYRTLATVLGLEVVITIEGRRSSLDTVRPMA